MAEESKHDIGTTKRAIEPYFEAVKKNTEFFSTSSPDTLVNEIGGYLQEKGHAVKLDPKKYKLKVTLKNETEEGSSGAEGAVEEEPPVEISIKILEVQEGKYCVEFTRTAGDQLQFFEEYTKIHDELADLANA